MRRVGIMMIMFLILGLAQVSGAEVKRVALVIGNGTYTDLNPLKNPVNDANDMTTALKKLGFDVQKYTNVGYADMENAIRDFAQRLSQGGIGLFYYAGHGVQYEQRNYLAPSDAAIFNEVDIKYKMIAADYVLEQMAWANNQMNIMILDACRSELPFKRSVRVDRAVMGSGLTKMDAPKGTVIAFATSPNNTAKDGDGRNGTFTKNLLAALQENPCRNITDLLIDVTGRVDEETHGKQTPWQHLSLLRPFALAQCEQSAQTTPATPFRVTPMPTPKPAAPILSTEGSGAAACKVKNGWWIPGDSNTWVRGPTNHSGSTQTIIITGSGKAQFSGSAWTGPKGMTEPGSPECSQPGCTQWDSPREKMEAAGIGYPSWNLPRGALIGKITDASGKFVQEFMIGEFYRTTLKSGQTLWFTRNDNYVVGEGGGLCAMVEDAS